MAGNRFKFVVYVPVTHSDAVRQAMGEAGAGKIGNYDFCSFTIRGTGRFRPNAKSNPAIGAPGQFEAVEEDRIEVTIEKEDLPRVIAAVRNVHPYEEIAYDVYPLELSS